MKTIAKHTNQMNTTISSNPAALLYAGGLSLPTVITAPLFATVRIKTSTKTIRDGRYYKTEAQMNRYRSSRPASAVCIKINRRLNHGLIECEMI